MPTNIYQRTAMAAAIAACFPGYGLAAPVARVRRHFRRPRPVPGRSSVVAPGPPETAPRALRSKTGRLNGSAQVVIPTTEGARPTHDRAEQPRHSAPYRRDRQRGLRHP